MPATSSPSLPRREGKRCGNCQSFGFEEVAMTLMQSSSGPGVGMGIFLATVFIGLRDDMNTSYIFSDS